MNDPTAIPAYGLYGQGSGFPDLCHVETVTARAAGHDWVIRPHRHADLHQIIVVTAGTTETTLDGDTAIAEAPLALNLPRHSVHGFAFEQGTVGHVFSIPAGEVSALLDGSGAVAQLLARPARIAAPPPLLDAMATLTEAHARNDALRTPLLRARAEVLLCEMAAALAGEAGAQRTVGMHPLVARFDAYIGPRLGDRLVLQDIAARIGVSQTHMARVIRAETGTAPHQRIADARLREASRQLAYTRRPIADIGEDLGFGEASYFSRTFKRFTGESPREYRRRLWGDV